MNLRSQIIAAILAIFVNSLIYFLDLRAAFLVFWLLSAAFDLVLVNAALVFGGADGAAADHGFGHEGALEQPLLFQNIVVVLE